MYHAAKNVPTYIQTRTFEAILHVKRDNHPYFGHFMLSHN